MRASDGRTNSYLRVKGLKEWNFGLFEAQPERLQSKFRAGATSFEDLFVPYGGEAVEQVGERVLMTLTEVMEKAQAEPILAVSPVVLCGPSISRLQLKIWIPRSALVTVLSVISIMTRSILS
ncbi:histidine phosphatase family protein [Streptococcus constellatus]|nr:histidine phosphatase family protein [Streptococcus constellatus]